MDAAELLAPFERLLEDVCTPATVREIEAGGSASELWSALVESGFIDALVPEEAGGVGLSLREIGPLLQALGRFAVPVPVAETMVARALLAEAGVERPAGPIVLATGHANFPVPTAKVAGHALVDTGDELLLASLDRALPAAVHHSLAASLPKELDGQSLGGRYQEVRPIAAVIRASAIAGAADRLLAMTLAYANERVQFGKPIAKQQAIQHQLAVMAERTVACRLAAQIGCAGGFPPSLVAAATAKQVTSSAAVEIASIAHAVHGAIGISEEFDLQLYTRRLHEWRLADGSERYWARALGEVRLAQPDVPSVDFIRSPVRPERSA
jgi:acyl-CoA dehydrogenase